LSSANRRRCDNCRMNVGHGRDIFQDSHLPYDLVRAMWQITARRTHQRLVCSASSVWQYKTAWRCCISCVAMVRLAATLDGSSRWMRLLGGEEPGVSPRRGTQGLIAVAAQETKGHSRIRLRSIQTRPGHSAYIHAQSIVPEARPNRRFLPTCMEDMSTRRFKAIKRRSTCFRASSRHLAAERCCSHHQAHCTRHLDTTSTNYLPFHRRTSKSRANCSIDWLSKPCRRPSVRT